MATPDWTNVTLLATGGTGASGTPWTGWDTLLTGSNIVYYFPAGFYDFNPFTISNTAVYLVGDGKFATRLRSLSNTGNGITLSGSLNGIHGMDIEVKGTATAGYLINIASTADQYSMDRVRLSRFFNGVQITGAGGGRFEDVRMFPAIAATTAFHMVNCGSAILRDVSMSVTANITTAFDIEFNSGVSATPLDTINMLGCEVSCSVTSVLKAVWIHGDTQAPELIHMTNCFFECALNTGTSTCVLECGRDVRFSNCHFLGGENALLVTTGGSLTKDFNFTNCIFMRGNKETVKHDNQNYLQLIDCTVAGASQLTTNTYDSVVLGSASDGFTMKGGSIFGTYGIAGITNAPRYGVTVTAGAKNYITDDVTISGMGTGPINGTLQTVASAATITPLARAQMVSGTTTIQTINVPAWPDGTITLIPTGAWATNTAGNISIATTAVVGKALILTFNANTNKWYPSY